MNEQPFSLLKWIEANPALVSLIAIPIAALIGAWVSAVFARYGGHGLKEIVADPQSRPGLITRYGQTRRDSYFRSIGWVLERAEILYGEKPFGASALTRCIQIAYIYPPLALMIGWVLFETHTVAGIVFLPVESSVIERLLKSSALLGIMMFNSWAVLTLGTIVDDKGHTYTKTGKSIRSWLTTVARPHFKKFEEGVDFRSAIWVAFAAVSVVLLLMVSGWIIGEILGKFLRQFSGLVAVIITSVGTISAFTVTFGLAMVPVMSLGTIAISMYFYEGSGAGAFIMLLFFAVFPVLNAAADFVSIAASRVFLKRIHVFEEGVFRIVRDVGFDLAIAALCLVALVGSMIAVFEIWSFAFPNAILFDWRDYRNTIQNGDWGQATMLVLMVITTLIPTILHLVFGLAGFWMAETKSWGKAVRKLQSAGSAEMPAIEQAEIIRLIRRGTFWGWFRSLITVGLGCAVLGWLVFRYILPLLA